jgi:hypothetical protein
MIDTFFNTFFRSLEFKIQEILFSAMKNLSTSGNFQLITLEYNLVFQNENSMLFGYTLTDVVHVGGIIFINSLQEEVGIVSQNTFSFSVISCFFTSTFVSLCQSVEQNLYHHNHTVTFTPARFGIIFESDTV